MSPATIAYFDCIGGASGDMILGALLDAGLDVEVLRDRLAALRLEGFELRAGKVSKNGFAATQVEVVVEDEKTERHLPEIVAIVESSDLPDTIKQRAIGVFRRLGEVEAGIHGSKLERVHLHELGGVDTIVDVVGALVGLEELGVERIVVSPLPMGRGFVSGAHGQIPLPAPATLALLKGVPLVGRDLEVEFVTPTGAALLSTLASSFGSLPPMSVSSIGYGAGAMDLPIPNVLRLLLGEESGANISSASVTEPMVILETNIDDMNPEVYDYVTERLFGGGALDVTLSPVQMKKNRPGTLLRVLCRPPDAEALTGILFGETSTLGVRQLPITRTSLARSTESVKTEYGQVRVKLGHMSGEAAKLSPEYDDCRRLAAAHGVPLREVYRAAERVAEELLAGDRV